MYKHLEAAQLIYQDRNAPRSFEEDLWQIIDNESGYLLSTPELFVMARGVHFPGSAAMSANPAYQGFITDPKINFDRPSWNCWHIHVFAGGIKNIFTWQPFKLPFVSWEKHERLRIYNLKTVEKKWVNSQHLHRRHNSRHQSSEPLRRY